MQDFLYYLFISLKVFGATMVGAVIGYDRDKAGKPAGMKTHAMVCLGACLIMIIGNQSFYLTQTGDPMRLAAQVVSVISFLCGGVIIVTHKSEIKGLTTAATLWFVACLGLCIGSDSWWVALPSVCCYWLITHVVKDFEKKARETYRHHDKDELTVESEDKIVS